MFYKLFSFILFGIICFTFVSCEEDDTNPEQISTITGKLKPGENITTDDFREMQVILAKLSEDLDPEQVTTQTEDMELVQTSLVSENGTFVFDSVDAGNYVIALSEGFIMTADTFAVLSVKKGQSVTLEDKIAERQPPENPYYKFHYYYDVTFKNKSFGIDENGNYHKNGYSLVSIEFYENGSSIGIITPDKINNKGEFKIELYKYEDPQFVLKCKDNVDGTVYTSEKLDFFYSFGAKQRSTLIYQYNFSLFVDKSWLFGHKIELRSFDYNTLNI
ncbi:carboxypeptidase-like regulatory domain-containing protein [Thermophagus sp. OGC60D27]|uniref:carboxypeptidase-like regulatory domain-containing protein n=1 Tax=Thermophagus sp. OGC60D27 TaxID=3458415 RepID=UPI004037CDE5